MLHEGQKTCLDKINRGFLPKSLHNIFFCSTFGEIFRIRIKFYNTAHMSEKLDKIDLKILKILQDNSKITNLDLSKKIGLSPAPTLERVKKLEQSEIILSYHAQVSPQQMGLNVKTFVLVSLAWKKENALNNFLEKIALIDEVTECYIITGEADFLMKIICRDIPSYEQLLFKTISQIEEIERLKTLMTLSTVKDSKVLPYNYEDK
jgi:Lrp/AsnC family transcriptional regulator, leucine-responsive regulatory protein